LHGRQILWRQCGDFLPGFGLPREKEPLFCFQVILPSGVSWADGLHRAHRGGTFFDLRGLWAREKRRGPSKQRGDLNGGKVNCVPPDQWMLRCLSQRQSGWGSAAGFAWFEGVGVWSAAILGGTGGKNNLCREGGGVCSGALFGGRADRARGRQGGPELFGPPKERCSNLK